MRWHRAGMFQLADRTKVILKNFSTSCSVPSCIARRSGIVLLAAEGKTNDEIVRELQISYCTVATWRKRFACYVEKISRAEKVRGPVGEERLANLLMAALSDRERPGSSYRYTKEQIEKICGLACRNPEDFGYDRKHWSLTSLAREVVNQGIVEAISPSSVQRILKTAGIEPWKNCYWLAPGGQDNDSGNEVLPEQETGGD